jgi:hypothetical protein
VASSKLNGGRLSYVTSFQTTVERDAYVKHETDIVVHLETPEGSRAVGTILPFDLQPPADVNEGDLGGVKVKFTRKLEKVISVQVATLLDAEILIKALGRK